MKYLSATCPQLLSLHLLGLQLLSTAALAQSPHPERNERTDLVEEPFYDEYALGVRKMPLDGGKIYGWQMNDRVTFGRFKGENDEFGFSVILNEREHVEITTGGLRWRHALGGER